MENELEPNNRFLLELLDLQQDGKSAISAPRNWLSRPPLLNVETEIDGIVDELKLALLGGEDGQEGRWHFFIGSPGNGKSAAMGKLARELVGEMGCRILDDRGVSLETLDPNILPYSLDVCRTSDKFASAKIVQDASVVKNPYSARADPSGEILEVLHEAWSKGISLVVCTNRGVIEKALRDYPGGKYTSSPEWIEILSAVVKAKPSEDGRLPHMFATAASKSVFSKVAVSYSHLDNRSLLLGKDIFARLLIRATEQQFWGVCESCAVSNMCPFYENRNWIAGSENLQGLVTILSRAEALSGQVIVFREALALISLILAGCPQDYRGLHPCDWVRDMVREGEVFSLATRRIYMILFASYCRIGLDPVEETRKRQFEAISHLCKIGEENQLDSLKGLEGVCTGDAPSTDVGIGRLLGQEGALAELDPVFNGLPMDFFAEWNTDNKDLDASCPDLSDIERACVEVWRSMEDYIELSAPDLAPELYWATKRWSSSFLLRLGALLEERSAQSRELDQFIELYLIMSKPPQGRSVEEKLRVIEFADRLDGFLNKLGISGPTSSLNLSPNVVLRGPWANDHLRPTIGRSTASGSVSLVLKFDKEEQSVFSARAFIWLKLLAEGGLNPQCIPQEVLTGIQDARIRAAAKSKYAFKDNNVELGIRDTDGQETTIKRIDGDVAIGP